MSAPLVSIIVPIYMIDRYIGICIESIINQSYKNIEILLVDDGSKDRSAEICDLYAKKDCRIKVIHKPNGGLVSARKAGLQESNGEYISYVDGDDWIGTGFIESLVTAAVSNNADMVCAGQTRDLFSKSAHFTNNIPSGVYSDKKLEQLWLSMISLGPYYRNGISTYVWNKLFRRNILLDAQFAVDNRISIGEDGTVTYPTLLKCNCVVVTDNVAYHYRQREDSMLKQSTSYADDAQKLKYLYDYLTKWAQQTNAKYNIQKQITDYVLSIAIMRFGGRLPNGDISVFDPVYYGKKVLIYSAGTFGQQLVNRFKESNHCKLVAWLDDDYWEYRRCCLDVDPVDSITALEFDFILISTVDSLLADNIEKRLLDFGVSNSKILTITIDGEREKLLNRFLDVDSIRAEEKQNQNSTSHA